MLVVCEEKGSLKYIDGLYESDRQELEGVDLLETVFENGKLLRDETLSEIRERLKG